MRKILAITLCLLILLGITGCAAASVDKEMAMGMAPEAAVDNSYVVMDESITADTASQLPENRKLIQTVRMNVETEDLDAVLQQIEGRIGELGGYTESSNVHNGSAYGGRRYRSASLTVRIPAASLDVFVDKVGEVSNIVSSNKTVEDVTLSYVATESRMKALQTEETRLLELLAQAETLDDILNIESRLTDVRTELEQVTSALRLYDNQVDYATIHLSVEEVTEYTDVTEPETVWQRIGKGFVKSLKGVGNFFRELFVFLIVASPYLLLVGAIALGVVLIIRLSIRRKRKKAAKNQPQIQEKSE